MRKSLCFVLMVGGLASLLHVAYAQEKDQDIDQLGENLLKSVHAWQLAVTQAKLTCPVVLLKWSQELQLEGLGVHRAEIETLAQKLAEIPEQGLTELPPLYEDKMSSLARIMCPRWLLTWSEDLKNHERSQSCLAVAHGAKTITSVFNEELRGGYWTDVQMAIDTLIQYNEAVMKASDAAMSFCESGSEADWNTMYQYQDEALAIEKQLGGFLSTEL